MTSNKFIYPFILFIIVIIITSHPSAAKQDSTSSPKQYPQLRVVGFLQQQYIDDRTTGRSSQFTIHRARVGIAGKITDRISVNVVGGAVEPPDRTPRLVNAIVDIDIHRLLNVRMGQFLVPFGLEGPEAIPFNPAIERSTAIRRLNTFRMFRDIGVQLSGQHQILSYKIALINGDGANPTFNTPNNDFTGRFTVKPFRGFEIGVSAHLGYFQSPNGDTRDRNRTGFDFNYDYDAFLLRGEYIIRRDEISPGNYIDQVGGYIVGGLRIGSNWELIGRFELYDPDTSLDNNRYTGITLGGNYYIEGRSRISANYEFRTDDNFPGLGNLFTVQMQITL